MKPGGNGGRSDQTLAGRENFTRSETTPTTVWGRPFNRISRPMSVGSLPKRVRQSPSLSTTAVGAGPSSVERNVRPATGVTPSTSKNLAETNWRSTLSTLPSGASSSGPPPRFDAIVAVDSNDRFRSCKSRKLTGPTGVRPAVGLRSQTITSRSGSG